jgi:CDP-diacylglycerol pyrophosphatase
MKRIPPKAIPYLIAIAVLSVLAVGAGALLSDRAALWHVVRLCAADAALTGHPFPCLKVDTGRGAADGYAVLMASLKRTHVIVTPLVRIDGIEGPTLQEPGTPNYVADAWAERDDVAAHASRPLQWDDFGMAVNSYVGRSQDQLHIHMECVLPRVRAILKAHETDIPTGRWSEKGFKLEDISYRVTRLPSDKLDDVNIFALAAKGLAIPQNEMFNLSLALVGAQFADGSRGFYLLADQDYVGRSYAAHAEYLLDPTCDG